MSNISKRYVGKHASPIEIALFYRCFFDAGGVGLPGLTPAIKVTKPDGTNMTPLVYGAADWTFVERTNVIGDYEVVITLREFTSFGQYTIEIDSQDPGAGKLVTYFTLEGVYGWIYPNTPTPTPTAFAVNLPSTVTDFYKDSYFLPVTGANAGCGPKKVTGYTSGKVMTINALPVTPSEFDVFYLIRF